MEIAAEVATDIAKKEVALIADEVSNRIAIEETETLAAQEELIKKQMEEDDKMYESVIEQLSLNATGAAVRFAKEEL